MKKTLSLIAAALFALAASAQGFQMPKTPENIAHIVRGAYETDLDGRSSNFSPTFFIYPDAKLDQDGAKALVEELGMGVYLEKFHASLYVINPVGKTWDEKADWDAFVEAFNMARSGNLKVVAFGSGATFVNAVVASKAADHIAGIATIGGKPGKTFKGESYGVPAYVAGANAAKVAKNYQAMNSTHAADEPLLQVVVNTDKLGDKEHVAAAWESILKKNYRFNNYKHTHYNGCKFGEFGAYELEPYTIWEDLGMERKVVRLDQRGALPWIWYEYWPKELLNAPEASVPVMVLLHGNTNDPRTQAETSGFLELAVKEKFFVVEMEWQGSKLAGAMGYDGIESVLYQLLDTYPQLDGSRIYAEGLSAGSMTASALGIRKSHVFAAVGGHSGGLFGGNNAFSNYRALLGEATQKRGAVEMPYCSVLGTADQVVPFITPTNYKGNGYLNAWNAYQTMNGMEVLSELDFSKDALFGMQLRDRETITTTKGAGIKVETGQLYKGSVPMIKFVAVVDYGHWNFKPTAQIMWDFFKHYSRDQKTGKLNYTK